MNYFSSYRRKQKLSLAITNSEIYLKHYEQRLKEYVAYGGICKEVAPRILIMVYNERTHLKALKRKFKEIYT